MGLVNIRKGRKSLRKTGHNPKTTLLTQSSKSPILECIWLAGIMFAFYCWVTNSLLFCFVFVFVVVVVVVFTSRLVPSILAAIQMTWGAYKWYRRRHPTLDHLNLGMCPELPYIVLITPANPKCSQGWRLLLWPVMFNCVFSTDIRMVMTGEEEKKEEKLRSRHSGIREHPAF